MGSNRAGKKLFSIFSLINADDTDAKPNFR